ncbi:hypothetical protein ACM66B_006786 [Microbotryomycetes sp. NB124-2]
MSNGAVESKRRALKQSTLAFDQLESLDYIATLNQAQRRAVTAPCDGSIQILAGPGSGKTKVLTSRVAYLMQHYHVDPADMIVVTFTNKAANEMKVRLAQIVGTKLVDKLMMGTFHSVCVRYLRKYGKLIGLPTNFVIADRDDCLNMIKRAVTSTEMSSELKAKLKPNKLADVISQCKSKEVTPEMYRARAATTNYKESQESMEAIHRVYVEYEEELERNNALDFDDLLLKGLELLNRFPKIVSKIRCVLIDEFQDTNATQYTLVKLMARANKSLTIVGDPDQSIYGWRSADVENLVKMSHDFEPVQQILLEQNYRSTAAILGAAIAVVREDTKRINKGLKATHATGSSVVIHHAPSAFEEAQFIAAQIKHVTAHAGGLLDNGDVAILLRYGALSRNIEVAFQKEGIPFRVVGGHKFFDRVEVKDMISYLQLADNPSYSAAFQRVINSPKRGFGDKTIKDIEQAARTRKLSMLDVCTKLAAGQSFVSLTSLQKTNLKQFVKTILEVKKLAEGGTSVPDLIQKVVELTGYEGHLDKAFGPDAKERLLNIEELKSFAMVVGQDHPETLADDAELEAMMDSKPIDTTKVQNGQDNLEDSGIQDDDLPDAFPASQTTSNPLRTFLAMSMLAIDATSDSDEDGKDGQGSKQQQQQKKVTITTVHAAKGLEWPVVFVPACENGVFPFYRSEKPDEVDEERRLLYVAITRAKVFCTLTHCATRMAGAKTSSRDVSPFLKPVAEKYPSLFVKRLQKIGAKNRQDFARVLGRPVPDEKVVAQTIQEYESSLPENPPTYEYDPNAAADSSKNRYSSSGGFQQNRHGSSSGSSSSFAATGPQPVPPGAQGFSSALSRYRDNGTSTGPFASTSAPRSANSSNSFSRPSSTSTFGSNAFGSSSTFGNAGFGVGSSIPLAPSNTAHSQGDIDSLPAPPARQPYPPMRANARNLSRGGAFKPPRMSGSATTRPSAPLGTPIQVSDHDDDAEEALSAVDVTAQISAGQPIPLGPKSPQRQSSAPSASTVPPLSPPRPKLNPQGLPNVPETRSSRIADAVLVNPQGDFDGVPSDLLERWTKGEKKRFLDAFQGNGPAGGGGGVAAGGGGEGDLPSSDPSVVFVEDVPTRSKRGRH